MKNQKIMIIGGGPAGVALSLFLHKAGISSLVYEAYPPDQKAGIAFTIAPNGIRVLAELGLADYVLAQGNTIAAYEFKNGKGKHIARMHTGPIEKYGYAPVLIERPLLQNTLNAAAKAADIPIYYYKRLINVLQDADQVIATFADGSTATADLLIAADGIHSITRQLLFADEIKPNYVGFYGVGALVNKARISQADQLSPHDMTLVYGNNAFFGYGFDKADELLWWSSIEVPENEVKTFILSHTDEQLKAKLLEQFKDYAHPVKELVAATERFTQTASYELGELQCWHKGRVMLIGDAAHALSTTSGQGVSMAFEDALLLAKLLRDQNYDTAFPAFEAKRKPRIDRFRKEAKRGNADKKVTNPFMLFIREKLMAFFISLFAEKGLVWQYGYRENWD